MSNLENKKIIFFGTPVFVVDFLEDFKKNGLEIVAVVTGVDKPVGRGQNMQKPGAKVWAEKFAGSIQIFQPAVLDDNFYEELKAVNADLFVVIAYGKIIPEKIINLPKFGTINLHYSLLPKYRGASPVESAILNNESVTGITIQQMVYKLDAGNILYQEEMSIEANDTTETLRDKMNKRAMDIFPEFLENLFSNKISPIQQDENLATRCGKFLKEDLNVTEIIKEKNISKLYTMFRTFPRKIYFFHGENNLRIKITDMNNSEIKKVIPENRKEISGTEFEKTFGKII